MDHPQRNAYLESKILTAPSHRLHLMLVEGALRFGRQAAQAFNAGDTAAAQPALNRAIDIAGEMLAGLRGQASELNRKLSGIYAFILDRLALAKFNNDAALLAEALSLLEYERETWQMLSNQHSGGDVPESAPRRAEAESARPSHAPPAMMHSSSNQRRTGFSLDA